MAAMRIYTEDGWQGGYLDEHRPAGWHRIRPFLWVGGPQVPDGFVEHPRDWRIIWNYAREIGVRGTWSKVQSRLAERDRNRRYIGWGFGRVLESPDGAEYGFFWAPFHPKCMERIVVPPSLFVPLSLFDAGLDQSHEFNSHALLVQEGQLGSPLWPALAGWSPWSGDPIPARPDGLAAEMAARSQQCFARRRHTGDMLPARDGPVSCETPSVRQHASKRLPSAVLLGYGNYAKSIVLPRVSAYLHVQRIHELDPLQIGRADSRDSNREWATSADPPEEAFEYYLVAGYHHFHAPHSEYALRRHATVFCEKPIATTTGQLDSLLDLLDNTRGRLFAGYHKRYSPLTSFALQDLADENGNRSPISYHAIVYEIPLPSKHWYRWRHSGSPIMSNGCHWIDHCLMVNNWSAASGFWVKRLNDGAVAFGFDMSNGASFSAVLTHKGSRRVGVQNYVELRTATATAKIVNDSVYMAENGRRVLRRAHVNRLGAYGHMYRTLANRATAGASGDSHESLEMSCRAVLALDSLYQDLLP